MTENSNRVVRVPLHREIIEPLFRGEYTSVEGLPDDASLVRWYDDPARDQHVLIFQSDEFEPVDEGEVIPELHLFGVRHGQLQRLVGEWRDAAETFDGPDEREKIKAANIRKCADELEHALTPDEH